MTIKPSSNQMEWQCSGLIPFRLAAMGVLSAILVFVFFIKAKAYGAETHGAFSNTRFYQFFTDPQPTIQRAVFKKEMFSSEIPEQARKQTFCLDKEGDDYILRVLAGTNANEAAMSVGSYKGRSWGLINNELTFSDPAINKRLTPIAGQESVTRMTANLLINLGITELVRSSLVWDEKNRHFVGKSTSGGELIIGFEFANQLPKRALIISAVQGGVAAFIDYEYSSAIFNGEIPFRFSRHFGSPAHDMGKAFLVELLEVDSRNNKTAGLDLDPVSAFRPRTTGFYSNDMVYTLGASGKPTRALTMTEYQTSLASLESNKRSKNTIGGRIFVFSALGLGLVALIGFLVRTKKQQKEQTKT